MNKYSPLSCSLQLSHDCLNFVFLKLMTWAFCVLVTDFSPRSECSECVFSVCSNASDTVFHLPEMSLPGPLSSESLAIGTLLIALSQYLPLLLIWGFQILSMLVPQFPGSHVFFFLICWFILMGTHPSSLRMGTWKTNSLETFIWNDRTILFYLIDIFVGFRILGFWRHRFSCLLTSCVATEISDTV